MLEGRSYRLVVELYAGGAQLYAFGVHLNVKGVWIFMEENSYMAQ